MNYLLILLYFFLGILFFHTIGEGFSVGVKTHTEVEDLERQESTDRHSRLGELQTWTKKWNPLIDSANQWAALLEWLSLTKNMKLKTWIQSINTFRNGEPVYILTTRYIEPWGTASKGTKERAERGVYGARGPCYNPNTDNLTTRSPESLESDISRRKKDQAERDSRWLLVWERIAEVAAISGGKAIQIYISKNRLSEMQHAEADIANRVLLPIIRQPIQFSYDEDIKDKSELELPLPTITYGKLTKLKSGNRSSHLDIKYCKKLLSNHTATSRIAKKIRKSNPYR